MVIGAAQLAEHERVEAIGLARGGAEAIAAHLGIDLAESIGAGDASPDDFLAACGFAVIVGSNTVDYKGLRDTVRVEGIAALGKLLATG